MKFRLENILGQTALHLSQSSRDVEQGNEDEGLVRAVMNASDNMLQRMAPVLASIPRRYRIIGGSALILSMIYMMSEAGITEKVQSTLLAQLCEGCTNQGIDLAMHSNFIPLLEQALTTLQGMTHEQLLAIFRTMGLDHNRYAQATLSLLQHESTKATKLNDYLFPEGGTISPNRRLLQVVNLTASTNVTTTVRSSSEENRSLPAGFYTTILAVLGIIACCVYSCYSCRKKSNEKKFIRTIRGKGFSWFDQRPLLNPKEHGKPHRCELPVALPQPKGHYIAGPKTLLECTQAVLETFPKTVSQGQPPRPARNEHQRAELLGTISRLPGVRNRHYRALHTRLLSWERQVGRYITEPELVVLSKAILKVIVLRVPELHYNHHMLQESSNLQDLQTFYRRLISTSPSKNRVLQEEKVVYKEQLNQWHAQTSQRLKHNHEAQQHFQEIRKNKMSAYESWFKTVGTEQQAISQETAWKRLVKTQQKRNKQITHHSS